MGYDWVSQDANLSVEEMDEDTVYEDLEYEIVYTKASKLYQAFWDGESYDEYILCYPDKIIKVSPNFTKELTDEDLVIIDEELGGLK